MFWVIGFFVFIVVCCMAGVVLVQRALRRKNDKLRKESQTEHAGISLPPSIKRRPKQSPCASLYQQEQFRQMDEWVWMWHQSHGPKGM